MNGRVLFMVRSSAFWNMRVAECYECPWSCRWFWSRWSDDETDWMQRPYRRCDAHAREAHDGTARVVVVVWP